MSDKQAECETKISEVVRKYLPDDFEEYSEPAKKEMLLVAQGKAEVAAEKDAEIERLREWVNDLQSGMYINCVYCGHRYGPSDEVASTMQQALYDHIAVCPEHPLSRANAEIARLKDGLETIANGPADFGTINCALKALGRIDGEGE